MPVGRQQSKRRLGLTASSPYASLHANAHDKHAEAGAKRASSDEESITAPPKSSDESSSSDSDEPSQLKKRKLNQTPRSGWTPTLKQLSGQPSTGPEDEETDLGVFARRQKIKNKYSNTSSRNLYGNRAGPQLGKKNPIAKQDSFKVPSVSKPAEEKPATKKLNQGFKAPPEISNVQDPKPELGSEFKAPPKPAVPRSRAKNKKAAAGSEWKEPISQFSSNGSGTRLTRSSRSKSSPEQATSSFRPPLNLENLAKKFELQDAFDIIQSQSQRQPLPAPPDTETTLSFSPLSSTHSVSSLSPSSLAATEVNEPASSSTSLSTTMNLTSISSSTAKFASIPTASCPLCKSPVPPSILENFASRLQNPTSNALWSVHQQAAFHKVHLTAEAETLWKARHYPTIDWSSLSARFEELKSHISSVLEGTASSYYRSRLRSKVEGTARRTRTVAHELATGQDGAEDVGYYGGKGQKLMGDWLINTYSRRLRELAVQDKDIVSAGGVGAFVQKVLMPELAHGLIMSDLKKNMEMGKGVRKRAKSKAKEKEEEVKRRLESQGLSKEEIERRVKEEAAIDWSLFDLKKKEKKEWVGRWIAEESADVGRLVCEEEDDEIPVNEEAEEVRKE